jgi:hypothetical protein
LIAQGHNARDVLDYSPKQIAAFLAIASHRRRREMREQLVLGRLAAQGDDKATKATLKELDD